MAPRPELALTQSRELRLARSAHSRLAVLMARTPMAPLVRSRPVVVMARTRTVRPVHSRLVAVLALILTALLVPPVHSLLEVQMLARVHSPQPELGSLALPMRAQSHLLVAALLRPTMRMESSSPALRPSR